ncbi:hypothetical protein SynRS9907_02027 [Synechococcus sp. RS9907]|nr:hypothetical protein SynRS9907_02027 [Synechococcus sp. RS9907]
MACFNLLAIVEATLRSMVCEASSLPQLSREILCVLRALRMARA